MGVLTKHFYRHKDSSRILRTDLDTLLPRFMDF